MVQNNQFSIVIRDHNESTKTMCKFCENPDNLLFYPTIPLGFGGELKSHVYIDAYNKQLCMQIINDSNGNIIDYNRICNFCPVCGKDFSKAE